MTVATADVAARLSVLVLRKFADKTGSRTATVDGSGNVIDIEPWPLAGIRIENDPVGITALTTTVVAQGRAEGWVTVEGENVVHRPGGPVDDLWRVVHTFMHYDAIVFHTVDGDVRFRVTRQPDKYALDRDDQAPVTDEAYAAGETRVDWWYGVIYEPAEPGQEV